MIGRLLDALRPRPVPHPGGGEPAYTIVYPPTMLWSNFQRPHNVLTQLARHHDVRALFNDWTVREEVLEGGRLIVTRRAFRSRYHAGPLVYYFSIPEKLDYLRRHRLRPDLLVFELMDIPEQEFASWKEKLPDALRAADIVRTTSEEITVYLRDRYADALGDTPVHTSRNGVDLELFDPNRTYARPPELADVERPIVGFYGNLDWWIDWALIERIAALDAYQVVVLGGTEGQAPKVPAELRDGPIRFLGWKPVRELPAYVDAFDLCLFPFVVNEMTDGVDALKLWEYLAFGRPVVATGTKFIRQRADLFYVTDQETVEDTLARALAEKDDAERVAHRMRAAAERDWRVIAGEMHAEIVGVLGGR